jgi:hypothetical protein
MGMLSGRVIARRRQFVRYRSCSRPFGRTKRGYSGELFINSENNDGGSPVMAERVDTGAVMRVLEPIWREKAETASRLRGRIESVLDHAKAARGWRDGENPARWRGHVANMLPKRSKVQPVEHHAALPWRGSWARRR